MNSVLETFYLEGKITPFRAFPELRELRKLTLRTTCLEQEESLEILNQEVRLVQLAQEESFKLALSIISLTRSRLLL
jgi:hypothetical protein